MDSLRSRGCPVSSLLWLTAGEKVLSGSRFGDALIEAVEPWGSELGSDPEFFRTVERHESEKIQAIRKDLRVVDREKMKCLVGFQALLERRGIQPPAMPFVFQTSNGKDYSKSRFHAYLHWQDALFEMLKIDFYGGIMDDGHFVPVTQVYELQPGEADTSQDPLGYLEAERVCYLIFDWEVLESQYLDTYGQMRLTSAQIARTAMAFPKFVYDQLLSRRYIQSQDVLHVVVKKKSRATSNDFKHSYHFIFEIAGSPAVHHKAVCGELFRAYAGDKGRMKKDKTFQSLSDEQLGCPVWGMDPINHGNQAFATLLSRKSKRDAYPQLRRRMLFQGGSVRCVEALPSWPANDGDIQLKLNLLRTASYTIPKETAIAYTDTALECIIDRPMYANEAPRVRAVAGRRGKPHDAQAPSAVSRGGEPDPFGGVERKKVHLPPWIESVLNSNGAAAYKLNTTMGCLDRQKEWLLSTRAWGDLRVVHVTQMFCPALLCNLPPVLHIHQNNGCMLAWDAQEETEVYLKCAYCNMKSVDTVEPREEGATVTGSWLRLTEDGLRRLMHTGAYTHACAWLGHIHHQSPHTSTLLAVHSHSIHLYGITYT